MTLGIFFKCGRGRVLAVTLIIGEIVVLIILL